LKKRYSEFKKMELAELILKYIEVFIWPGIAIYIIVRFRNEIAKLFERAKKVELPGGFSIEAFEDKLEEAKKLEQGIKADRKPEVLQIISQRNLQNSEANKRMIELGLRPSPSGLDLSYYKEVANSDMRLAMAGLRMDLELMLRNLADGFKIKSQKNESINKLINLLLNENAILSDQAEFMRIIFQLTNYAVHGGEVTSEQFDEVLELGETLVEDYIAWLDWGFK
jgi:hypothetical protein